MTHWIALADDASISDIQDLLEGHYHIIKGIYLDYEQKRYKQDGYQERQV